MIVLSILLAIATFIIGFVLGMFVLIARLEKRGMLKEDKWRK